MKPKKKKKKVRKYLGPSNFDTTVFVVGKVIFLRKYPNPHSKIECEAPSLFYVVMQKLGLNGNPI